MSTNKKRKSSPDQWSWTSQLYNATSLAEKATEQSETIEQLELALVQAGTRNDEIVHRLEEWKLAYQKWKANSVTFEKKNEAKLAVIASLKATNVVKQREIEELRHELQELRAAKCAEISIVENKLHETKRECTENRARKKMWKKKYDELANMGAIALAKVTKESYGVTPEQFEAYKNIADTQFEVDKAEKMRTDALKLLHANTKALEDQ